MASDKSGLTPGGWVVIILRMTQPRRVSLTTIVLALIVLQATVVFGFEFLVAPVLG